MPGEVLGRDRRGKFPLRDKRRKTGQARLHQSQQPVGNPLFELTVFLISMQPGLAAPARKLIIVGERNDLRGVRHSQWVAQGRERNVSLLGGALFERRAPPRKGCVVVPC